MATDASEHSVQPEHLAFDQAHLVPQSLAWSAHQPSQRPDLAHENLAFSARSAVTAFFAGSEREVDRRVSIC